MLYVNETESVRRQLARGKRTEENNEKVKQTGLGEVKEVRSTDISVAAARKRYKVFSEQALEALQSLKQEFPYHVIDGTSPSTNSFRGNKPSLIPVWCSLW